MKSAPIRVSVILLFAVFALCFYRAATQSLTIDEAFTFLHYVDTPWRSVFSDYSANNHVLFTWISRVFRYKFGRSEIVLRIPALIGCLLYLLASFRISRAAIGDRWLLPLALAVLTLNPLVLDFLVAARGYGLALGFFWWALYFLWQRKPWAAGVLAGLSIATNLTFLIPAAALGAVAIPIYFRRQRFWELIHSYGIPAIVIAFAVLVIPVSKGAGQFYYGAAKLADTVASLVNDSLPGDPNFISRSVVPWLFLLAMLICLWLLRQGRDESALPTLVLGTIGISVLCWTAMHRILGFVYPLNRTALYIVPLAGLAIALGAGTASSRVASWTLTALVAVLATFYCAQLRTGYFKEWKGEAAMNQLVRRLAQDASGTAKARQVTAGGSWILEYSTRYYGKRHRLPWLKVLDAGDREKVRPDYYILTKDDAKQVEALRLRVVEADAFSGTRLARSY